LILGFVFFSSPAVFAGDIEDLYKRIEKLEGKFEKQKRNRMKY